MKFSVLNDFYLNYLDRDKIRHLANLYWSHQNRQNTCALYIFEFFFPQCCVTDKHPKDPFLQIHFSAVRPFIWQSKYWLLLSEQWASSESNEESVQWGYSVLHIEVLPVEWLGTSALHNSWGFAKYPLALQGFCMLDRAQHFLFIQTLTAAIALLFLGWKVLPACMLLLLHKNYSKQPHLM